MVLADRVEANHGAKDVGKRATVQAGVNFAARTSRRRTIPCSFAAYEAKRRARAPRGPRAVARLAPPVARHFLVLNLHLSPRFASPTFREEECHAFKHILGG